MFKIIRKGMNRLDIEMSGKLNAEDMIIALEELVSKSKNIENGRMLYDFIDFHIPSLDAITMEFSASFYVWIFEKIQACSSFD